MNLFIDKELQKKKKPV